MVQQDEEIDLALAELFFVSRGVVAERIQVGKTKTPDFRLHRGDEVVGFCEVKSPQDIFAERTLRAIAEAPEGQLGGIIERGHTSRQYRCLERFARTASGQLQAANPTHSVPNILMIVNRDTHSQHDDFVEAVTGYFGAHRVVEKTLRDAFPEIDAYVWADWSPGGEEIERIEGLFRHESPLKQSARDLLKLG